MEVYPEEFEVHRLKSKYKIWNLVYMEKKYNMKGGSDEGTQVFFHYGANRPFDIRLCAAGRKIG
jgi:hypothetical protein